MSTLLRHCLQIGRSTVYIEVFSGKLSPVTTKHTPQPRERPAALPAATLKAGAPLPKAREVGGREGPEPTRYGDWELRGRCIDF
jgi:hypothetical protein